MMPNQNQIIDAVMARLLHAGALLRNSVGFPH